MSNRALVVRIVVLWAMGTSICDSMIDQIHEFGKQQ